MTTSARIPTIERVGALVRTRYHAVVRIVSVVESTRISLNHITSPGDVVVRVRAVGPGYRPETAWASELSWARPGDVGVHPHVEGECRCGLRWAGVQPEQWHAAPASWMDPREWGTGWERVTAGEHTKRRAAKISTHFVAYGTPFTSGSGVGTTFRDYAVEERQGDRSWTIGRIWGGGRTWRAVSIQGTAWTTPHTTRAAALAAMVAGQDRIADWRTAA